MRKKQLEKFIDIYKKEFGKELTEEEALEIATSLLKLYRAIVGDPLTGNNLEENGRK